MLASKTAATWKDANMKLEVGKFYMDGKGDKVGPMRQYEVEDNTFDEKDDGEHWGENGKHGEGIYGYNPSLNLIAEWIDETPAMGAIDHLRQAAILFMQAGNTEAAIDVMHLVIDHE